jgi:phage shock protein C
MINKKLYRSSTDRVFSGLCGGLGDYLDVDSTIIRLIWLMIVIFTGLFPGALVYLLAVLVVPAANQPG